MAPKKKRVLLEDENVKRWYNNTARGSHVTADVYLRRLGNYTKKSGIQPRELANKTESELFKLMLDLVTEMESQYSGSYIKSNIKAIKSWLAYNGIIIKRRIKIRGSEDTPTLKDERVPTQNELRKIFLSGDKKTRTTTVLIAHCGLRLKSVGNYLGDDGLRIKDLPELNIKNENISFDKIPTIVKVRKELSKARHQYITFLGEEGCEYLKDYLEMRQRQGEILTPDSAIITPKRKMKSFIRATNIGDIIRNAIRKAGYRWRPYVLRSYFDTMLMLSESKGNVLRDYRQFWMGHKGDIENRYTTNKGRLTETVIEDMRESYRKSQEFLQTTKVEKTSEDEMRELFRKQFLVVAGFTSDQIENIDLTVDDAAFQEIIRRKMYGSMLNNGSNQRVVDVSEAEKFIHQGWDYVGSLSEKKVIIKLPH